MQIRIHNVGNSFLRDVVNTKIKCAKTEYNKKDGHEYNR